MLTTPCSSCACIRTLNDVNMATLVQAGMLLVFSLGLALTIMVYALEVKSLVLLVMSLIRCSPFSALGLLARWQKGIRPVKSWMSVYWWCQFDKSFVRLIAPTSLDPLKSRMGRYSGTSLLGLSWKMVVKWASSSYLLLRKLGSTFWYRLAMLSWKLAVTVTVCCFIKWMFDTTLSTFPEDLAQTNITQEEIEHKTMDHHLWRQWVGRSVDQSVNQDQSIG